VPDLDLTDRVAVVTGASSGIGAGIAAMLAACGAHVVLAARREHQLRRVAASISASGGSALAVPIDLADDAAISRLVDRASTDLGPVDILVNNAGLAYWTPLEATSPAEWDAVFAVNVRAPALLCAAVVPGMRGRNFGRIINIGSEAGVAIVPGLAAYCVSKHALGALTEVIQDANHDKNIKAWCVCPGFVDTEMGEVVPGGNRDDYLKVEEVVDVVRYLLALPDNVKIGPEILVRTMRNPMAGPQDA
jgi:NADP-dependent 3-hydroxy acid dehydrogenase YdfG